ncbi:AbgT family transporter [Paenarthrobacter sp.]|uniref:AbgT family transporter n=1 Tax=Paenarthrobacter sp. TaxID=1931993 RepID=UPI00281280D7|nr:AbgT family transporter [Paenarthrobacter sp.]
MSNTRVKKKSPNNRSLAARLGFGFLNGVEKVGNLLPHPFILFVMIAAGIIVASAIASLAGAEVTNPVTNETAPVKSLASAEGLAFMLTSMLDNFLSFPPLGLVIVLLLGLGLANESGILNTALRFLVARVKHPRLITFVVILVGILSNLASESAAIVVPPLAALLFLSVGRHPIAGLAAGFGAVGAGFSANVIIAGTDVLLSGISTSAAGIVNPQVSVTPVSNWYFMSASTIVLTIVGVLVTEKIVEPRLGKYDGPSPAGSEVAAPVTALEKRGLRNAGIAALIFLAGVALLIIPENGILRGEDGAVVESPFMSSIVPLLFLLFLIVGIAYGKTTGTIKTINDVPRLMIASTKDLGNLLVLIFAVAQAIAYFSWSNLGLWFAILGADALKGLNVGPIGSLLIVSVATLFFSLIISSGSALWSLLAPVFIPMLMINGIDPAYTQLAFRIADSSTNMLVPLSPILAVALGYIQQYNKKAGIGTVFALMIPYAVWFFLVWSVLFVVWVSVGIPIGPGETLHLG